MIWIIKKLPMKYSISIFLIFTLINTSFAQNDRSELIFLEGLIRNNQPEGKIIYTDKINKNDLDKIKSKFKKNTIYDISKTRNQSFIILTKQEKKYLFQQLEIARRPYWKENIFPGSQLIIEEDAFNYIKKTTQEYLENYNKPTNSETDRMNLVKNYQRPNIFKFSKPIYLRNRSVCLIYFASICGNPCGFDELCFYKIANNTWTKWIVVKSNVY